MAIRNNTPFLQPDSAEAVTKSDTEYILNAYSPVILYVGIGGNLRVLTAGGDDVTYTAVEPGWFPVLVIRVFDTNTTAANIIANWNR